MKLIFQPMDAESAREMLFWRYEDSYAMYNAQIDHLEAEIAYQCDPTNHYFSIFHGDELVGHCVFHAEARVPGGDYSADALDVGIGMRPDWTGQGRGTDVTAYVLDFARDHYQPKAFRATVAVWNERAQRVCLQNGFQISSQFEHPRTGMEFIVLLKSIDSTKSAL